MDDVNLDGLEMRVQVRIDITKPLCRGIWVYMNEVQSEVSFMLSYEWLLDFCYQCGLIRDKLVECVTKMEEDNLGIGALRRYSEWLCVDWCSKEKR